MDITDVCHNAYYAATTHPEIETAFDGIVSQLEGVYLTERQRAYNIQWRYSQKITGSKVLHSIPADSAAIANASFLAACMNYEDQATALAVEPAINTPRTTIVPIVA